jgi:hypothetical protein
MIKAVLLIVHGLFAIGLIGAITHQAMSAIRTRAVPAKGFYDRFRNVNGAAYVTPIIWLYLITFTLGGIVYTWYRVDVRPEMEDLGMRKMVGSFELKEHLLAFGLLLLPMYYQLWKNPELAEYRTTRNIITVMLCLFVWWGLLTGHILNNYKGIYP